MRSRFVAFAHVLFGKPVSTFPGHALELCRVATPEHGGAVRHAHHRFPLPLVAAIGSERFCKRKTYPRAAVNNRGGHTYLRQDGGDYILNSWTEWFDLDKQLEHMDGLGHRVDVVCSIGPLSVFFSDLPGEEGRDAATQWNEEMAGAQRKYPGRLWASAAVPLVDTRIAIDVLDDAVDRLGLMGVNMPGSIGSDPRIDAERLEPSMRASRSSACRCSWIPPMRCSRTCSTATTGRCT